MGLTHSWLQSTELRALLQSLRLDLNLFDLATELERTSLEIVARDHRAEIDADVEALAGSKCSGHRHLYRSAGDFLAIHGEHDVRGSAGFRGFEGGLHDNRMFTAASFSCDFAIERSMIIRLYSNTSCPLSM